MRFVPKKASRLLFKQPEQCALRRLLSFSFAALMAKHSSQCFSPEKRWIVFLRCTGHRLRRQPKSLFGRFTAAACSYGTFVSVSGTTFAATKTKPSSRSRHGPKHRPFKTAWTRTSAILTPLCCTSRGSIFASALLFRCCLSEFLADLTSCVVQLADDDRTDAAEVRTRLPCKALILIAVRHAVCRDFKADPILVRNSAESRQRIGVRGIP